MHRLVRSSLLAVASALIFPVALLLLALCGCGAAALHPAVTEPSAQLPPMRAADGSSNIVPGRYIVLYRPGSATAETETLPSLNASIVQSAEPNALAQLASQPNVEAVLRDRYVEAHQMGIGVSPAPSPSDTYYRSPQNWAVVQAGGYGASIAGGPAIGPWNTTMGRGVRIAIIDSGVDATHPDIAPNLTLNLSEVDTTALPSPCDDGSPQDQHGHGTWTASLAAGAAGPTTGGVIGVAPQASLLNIKVLERLPANDGTDSATKCAAGQTGGLLSWVLKGIDDAIAAKADIISFSLGSLVDLQTGDGAGWKATFDRATHAAANAGIVLVAAAGNDGLDLSAGRYIELPAQARDVLPVVASTNPDCAENLTTNAICAPGPITRAFYSNHGSSLNAIAAPGGSSPNSSETGINGFVRGACSTSGCFGLGNAAYLQATGTSASAPLTAGAAALLRAAHPTWTSAQMLTALRSTARATPGLPEPILNTVAALTAIPHP